MRASSVLRRLAAGALACAAVFVGSPAGAADDTSALESIRAKGSLSFALYNAFAPFHDDGKGIDVDIAKALAKRLGVAAMPIAFDADEELSDDLRNMVWKGHYLGYGPADVMMHVPIDDNLIRKEDKVAFVAPYMRETIAIAWDPAKLDAGRSLAAFAEQPVAVDGTGIGALVMLGADGGAYRDSVRVFPTPAAAIDAVREGRLPAVVALRSEIEARLGDDARFEVGPVPDNRAPARGWPLGLAVKQGREDLARALQDAINAMVADGELDRIFAAHGVKRLSP